MAILVQAVEMLAWQRPLNAWRVLSLVALGGLAGVLAVTYFRRRVFRWDLWLETPLLVVASGGSAESLATVSLVLVVLTSQSLYGSTRMWAGRVVACLCSLPLAVALTPVSAGWLLDWRFSGVLALLPPLTSVCLVMRSVYSAMLSLERSAARDAVLARYGNLMLGATGVDQVYELGVRTASDLIALCPGVISFFARDAPEQPGSVGPLEIFAAVPANEAALGCRIPRAALITPADFLTSHAPAVRYWHVEQVGSNRYRFLGGVQPVRPDVIDSFRSMANQYLLAERSRLAAEALQHQAHHDPLTQLPNRLLFQRRLTDAVDGQPPHTVALLNIDLDDFKQVNDTYGHAAGDELLGEVARRVTELIGTSGCIARLGGDEFAVLLTGLPEPDIARTTAERLCEGLTAPIRLSAGTATVGASIGVVTTSPGLTATDLTRCADIAMYSAKARGKNRVAVFTTSEHGDIARHRTLETHIHHAIERNEITIQFQPSVTATGNTCVAVDATARWQHPTQGTIGAEELYDVAYRAGILTPIGSHIIQAACAQYLDCCTAEEVPRLAIGISAYHLRDPAFTEAVLAAVHSAGLTPAQITLVIPETESLYDPLAVQALYHVSDAGLAISVDRFGTGPFTLGAIQSFPLHYARLDPLLLASGDGKTLAMVVSIAHILGAQTLIPGVNRPEDLALARGANTDSIQGDLIAAPLTGAQLRQWVAANHSVS